MLKVTEFKGLNLDTEYSGLSSKEKAKLEELTTPPNMTEVSKLNFLHEILNAIETIKVSNDSIYIKTNKNIILHSNNSINISDNYNIQIAKQIHLNPIIKVFKKIQGLLK